MRVVVVVTGVERSLGVDEDEDGETDGGAVPNGDRVCLDYLGRKQGGVVGVDVWKEIAVVVDADEDGYDCGYAQIHRIRDLSSFPTRRRRLFVEARVRSQPRTTTLYHR